MGVVVLYGIRNCDTVKNARAWLLPEEDKAIRTEDKAVELMHANPSAIKGPVLDLGGRRVVGFKPDVYRSIRW